MYIVHINEGSMARCAQASGEETLLVLLQRGGSGIHAACGGNGKCGRCLVIVTGPCLGEDGQVRNYAGESILACRCYPRGDVEVTVPVSSGTRVLADAQDIPPCGSGLALAVDIGTTTMAAYLYDRASGRCLGSLGEENAQRAYGADVISRIHCAAEDGGLEKLRDCVREQIESMAARLCGERGQISYVTIAGNTVMEHIFAGLSPESIGVAPFRPLSLFGFETDADKYFGCFAPGCRVYLCPAVAGYVGGDITAGLLSSGAWQREGTVLFLDIGTNGEMALGSKDGFVCCAAAAGPAFEGAQIECGSPAVDGAINSVDPALGVTVLGEGTPRSICGSGLIDAVAALLKNGIVDETGRMDCGRHTLAGDVYISADDIRAVQLAKAAIRAGIETLLSCAEKSCEDIDQVLIAGGFGAYMSVQSACAIGLLPPKMLEKTHHVGNSAGKGAALALSAAGREALAEISAGCSYIELSSSRDFSDNYIEAMSFEDWEAIYG